MESGSSSWQPLWLSLQVAAWATGLALLLGTALGWVVSRTRLPGRSVLEAVFMLPLVLPPTVIGYAILVLAGRNGPVVASALVALPLVLKGASTAFAGVDRQLEAAARTLRQRPLSVFLRVTLPLAWPGILAGTLLAFARAMGEFGASLMVAGSIPGQTQTAAMAIYDAVQAGQDEQAFELALAISVLSVAILVASNHYLAPRQPLQEQRW
jgi:molybdate transport system permease protein